MVVLQADLNRLKSLRAEIEHSRNFVTDLKAIASESPSKQFRQLIDEAETKLANLQGELCSLTDAVTKAVRLTLTKPQMIEVVIRREVEGEPFESIAHRIKLSMRRTRELHKHGIKLMTAAA